MRHTSTSDYDPFYTIDFIKRGPRVREGSYGTGASAQRQYDPFAEDPAMQSCRDPVWEDPRAEITLLAFFSCPFSSFLIYLYLIPPRLI